jgi:hypothetical protein
MKPHAIADRMWVANWPKAGSRDSLSRALLHEFGQRGMLLDTCLRQLCISLEAGPGMLTDGPPGLEFHFGADAYRYALEVATGLRSAIPGETNVFGQLRRTWEAYRGAADAERVGRLAPLMHALINDARAIRKRYLEGIGGASYGTLVRRLLSACRDDRVLFIGAGELARSLLPYFEGYAVGLWHHRDSDFQHAAVNLRFLPGQASAAAAWADHLVFTTPPSARHDAGWAGRVAAARAATVLHLGYRRGDVRDWLGCDRFFVLDDVFELRRAQASLRSERLDGARAACRGAARELARAPAGHVAGAAVPA